MPNFTANFTAGATQENWADNQFPAPGSWRAPGTIDADDPGDPPGSLHYGDDPRHAYLGLPRIQAAEWPFRRWAATVGSLVTAKATVAGVEGELDVNLGGQLFTWWFAEWPKHGVSGVGPPSLVKTAGQSSVIAFTPHTAGHHTLVARRPNGGAVILHVDAT